MKIWVNQQEQEYPTSLDLLQLLESLNKATKTGIAVAVNNQIIPQQDWANCLLSANDKITIITATQGG